MQHTSYECLEQSYISSSEPVQTALSAAPVASTTRLQAALEYAKRGWLVFPLWWPTENGCACGKLDCAKVGKHPIPRTGVKSASIDERKIRHWFTDWPNANIGIATGSASDLIVFDADDREEVKGSDALNDLFRQHKDALETMIVRTGSGYHFYFRYSPTTVKNSVGLVANGVDVRSDGGYVVAPPSRHCNGRDYLTLVSEPIGELPEWLIELATPTRSLPAITELVAVPEGTRNNVLFRLACRLRGHEGIEKQDLLRIIGSYNEVHCNPPLAAGEIIAVVESACRYPPEKKAAKSMSRQNENPLWWMKFNVRNWFSDQNLNAMQDFQLGWYMRLLAFAWNKGGYLTVDPNELWRLAKAKSRPVFEKHNRLVLSPFCEVDGPDGQRVLRHDGLARDYAMTLEKWLQKIFSGERTFKSPPTEANGLPQEAD